MTMPPLLIFSCVTQAQEIIPDYLPNFTFGHLVAEVTENHQIKKTHFIVCFTRLLRQALSPYSPYEIPIHNLGKNCKVLDSKYLFEL